MKHQLLVNMKKTGLFFVLFYVTCTAMGSTTAVERYAVQQELVRNTLRDIDARANYLKESETFSSGTGVFQVQPTKTAAPPSSEELAKKLANPVAAMISVPFQFNLDRKIGPSNKGKRYTLNLQPVIPFSINDDWNVISRTIVPLVHQSDMFSGAGDQTGVGDIAQSFFFVPKKKTESGWILGLGPIFLLPTASEDLLGGEKRGVGPTFVGLKQDGPWTIGLLANHIWSVGGNKNRADINSTFIQPFVTYTTPDAWTIAFQTESTYNWETSDWSVPIECTVAKLMKFGEQSVSLFVGLKYWADTPDSGPEGLAFRGGFTLLFPF